MLGAIIGDIIGSAYEFNNYRAKDFQPLFHERAAFTDDTVCTVAVADSLTAHLDPASALRTWGLRYEKNGGWPPYDCRCCTPPISLPLTQPPPQESDPTAL